MLFLNKKDIRKVITMKEVIDCLENVFVEHSNKKTSIPSRTKISIEKQNGISIFMPGYIEKMNALGIKVVSVFPENAKTNKDVTPATMLILDANTGEVKCIMDGTYLTQLRTGAAAGVGTRALSKKDSKTAGIIGTGGQAICQMEAVLATRDIKTYYVYSRNENKKNDFVNRAKEYFKNFNLEIIPTKNSDFLVENSEIITVVTTSKIPVFDGSFLKKGTHINGVGSFTLEMIELDEKTVLEKADLIYVESLEDAKNEAGELMKPILNGKASMNLIKGEIGEYLQGNKEGRKTNQEITIFKTVGMAAEDIAVGYEIYKKALEKKIGTNIEMLD